MTSSSNTRSPYAHDNPLLSSRKKAANETGPSNGRGADGNLPFHPSPSPRNSAVLGKVKDVQAPEDQLGNDITKRQQEDDAEIVRDEASYEHIAWDELSFYEEIWPENYLDVSLLSSAAPNGRHYIPSSNFDDYHLTNSRSGGSFWASVATSKQSELYRRLIAIDPFSIGVDQTAYGNLANYLYLCSIFEDELSADRLPCKFRFLDCGQIIGMYELAKYVHFDTIAARILDQMQPTSFYSDLLEHASGAYDRLGDDKVFRSWFKRTFVRCWDFAQREVSELGKSHAPSHEVKELFQTWFQRGGLMAIDMAMALCRSQMPISYDVDEDGFKGADELWGTSFSASW